jgi:repressor LexA
MARPKTQSLTPRQREVLEWVKGFIQDHSMPPTVREIGGALGIKSSTVFYLLKALEQKGYLRRGDRGARSLIVETRQGRRRGSASGFAEIPVVGCIAAGQPIEAIEHDCGSVPVKKDLLRGCDAYALRVEGDSMVKAGILDGDYVIIRKQETAEDGDIVVALIEDEATLKRFYREPNGVRLEPANPRMNSVRVSSDEFKIQGKVIGVTRFMDGARPLDGS